MSLTNDYPNTDWATATESTVVTRISYPFKGLGDTTGIVYERDYIQARASYSPLSIVPGEISLQTTTCDGATGTGTGDLSVASTTGFPDAGKLQIDSEWITYTGKTATTFTGIARSQGQGTETSSAANHTDGTTIYSASWLIEETVPADVGPALVSFTRRYATVPSTITVYRWDAYSFVGYYSGFDTGGSSYRPDLTVLAPITETRTFAISGTGTFAVSGTRFKINKSDYPDRTEVRYVDATTDITYTAYLALVSGSTEIQISDNVIESTYGVGNIWTQIQSKTVAQ